MREDRKNNSISFLASCIVLIGFILRIRQYLFNRPLWLDELMLALNIRDRSFIELLQPLSDNQGAPIIFLWIEKFFFSFGGNKDLLLRVFPLLAGIVSIYLMWRVSQSIQNQAGSLLSIGFFAVLPILIYFSSEAKQYSSDVLITLLIFWMSLRLFKDQADWKSYLLFGITGLVGMWMSHPAVFILAGAGISLAISLIRIRDYRKLIWLSGCIFLWLISFALEYSISLQAIRDNPKFDAYWNTGYMPFPPWRDIEWFGRTVINYFRYLGYRNNYFAFIPISLLVIGTISIFNRRRQVGILFIIPILAMLIASSFEAYSAMARLLLFLVPITILFISEGIIKVGDVVAKHNPLLGRTMVLVFTILVLAQPIESSITYLLEPHNKEDTKSVLETLKENYREGDIIYLYYPARFSFWYYADQYGFDETDYIIGIRSVDEPEKYIAQIDQFIGKRRVWIVMTHNCTTCIVDEFDYILDHLNQIGTLRKKYIEKGAYLYLYNLKQPPQ